MTPRDQPPPSTPGRLCQVPARRSPYDPLRLQGPLFKDWQTPPDFNFELDHEFHFTLVHHSNNSSTDDNPPIRQLLPLPGKNAPVRMSLAQCSIPMKPCRNSHFWAYAIMRAHIF
jgi:hypothetical protein